MRCLRTSISSSACQLNHHDASSSGTRCRRSLTLRVPHELSHADGVRCLRTFISPSTCEPLRRLPLLTPPSAAALPCVFTMKSGTPMACAASAPKSIQARAIHHDASSPDTRCRRSLILRVHHHVSHADNTRCLRTITSPSACQPPRRYPFRHPRLLQLPFLRVHRRFSHAGGVRYLRTSISPSVCHPTRRYLSGTRRCRSLALRVHQHVSHADGFPCLRTSSSPSVCHPTRG